MLLDLCPDLVRHLKNFLIGSCNSQYLGVFHDIIKFVRNCLHWRALKHVHELTRFHIYGITTWYKLLRGLSFLNFYLLVYLNIMRDKNHTSEALLWGHSPYRSVSWWNTVLYWFIRLIIGLHWGLYRSFIRSRLFASEGLRLSTIAEIKVLKLNPISYIFINTYYSFYFA